MTIAYEKDIVAWANEQASFIRAGRFDLLDLKNIAEEIEDVGKSEQRELLSRMVVLFAHLLKWQFQPARRGASWRATISAQRKDIAFALKETPSLKTRLSNDEWIAVAWAKAIAQAIDETGLENFPESLPWNINEVLKEGWLPE